MFFTVRANETPEAPIVEQPQSVQRTRTGGNSRDRIIGRLESVGRLGLAARVRDGELSAHAAALEAGIRRDEMRLSAAMNGEAMAAKIVAKWGPSFAKGLSRWLTYLADKQEHDDAAR